MEIKYINKDTEQYKLIFSNVTLKAGSKVILENESFNITYNNMVILKGPIGSGKSSILKAVAGIYRIENGEILSTCNDDKVEAIYIHSQPELNFITGYIKDELQILGIKDYTPFEKYINKSVYELSGGALKKISLLMALHISNGRIILADEPLDMLDDIEAKKLSETIIEYSKTAPFIIATHDIHFDNFADVLLKL